MIKICIATWLIGGCINIIAAKKLDAIRKKNRLGDILGFFAMSWILIIALGIDYIGHKIIHR